MWADLFCDAFTTFGAMEYLLSLFAMGKIIRLQDYGTSVVSKVSEFFQECCEKYETFDPFIVRPHIENH